MPASLFSSDTERAPAVENDATHMILEVKHRPGKPPLERACEWVDGEVGKWARLRYVSDTEQKVQDTVLPVGTVTDGVYWVDRPFHVWKFSTGSGGHIGYRFDVCTNTFIWKEKLIWYDLELDLWIPSGGAPQWQDEDDMRRLVRMEHLSQEELDVAEQAKNYLDNHWADVIEGAFGEVHS
ncbi:MAG TPA: DUF402 domain-containing protein [Candidatus Latescibacteria bacterium]|nr:DUF402 domain-containing protein [Candidatus Latescibacterota bacterium]